MASHTALKLYAIVIKFYDYSDEFMTVNSHGELEPSLLVSRRGLRILPISVSSFECSSVKPSTSTVEVVTVCILVFTTETVLDGKASLLSSMLLGMNKLSKIIPTEEMTTRSKIK